MSFSPDALILDFGCGTGDTTESVSSLGYPNVYGFDINPSRIAQARKKARHVNPEHFSVIPTNPYRLPSDDGFFDFVVSGQVLEHVRDLEAALSELKRVLRPGGISVHIFPPMYRVFETHTHIPFGNILMKTWWHQIWIRMGYRQATCAQLSVAGCAEAHLRYIRNNTYYRLEKDFILAAQAIGLRADFIPGICYSNRIRAPQAIIKSQVAQWLYGTFVSKVLVLRNDLRESGS